LTFLEHRLFPWRQVQRPATEHLAAVGAGATAKESRQKATVSKQ